MTLLIRQIQDEDIDSFYETFSAVVRERRYLAFLEPPPIEMTRAFCRRNIEKGYPQLVARTGAQVVGWCDITPPGRDVMVHVGVLGISLHPDWRGRGLGENLMRQAIEAGFAFGFARIELGVLSGNAPARTLYRKLGFVEEGVRHGRIRLDGIDHDEIMMARFRD